RENRPRRRHPPLPTPPHAVTQQPLEHHPHRNHLLAHTAPRGRPEPNPEADAPQIRRPHRPPPRTPATRTRTGWPPERTPTGRPQDETRPDRPNERHTRPATTRSAHRVELRPPAGALPRVEPTHRPAHRQNAS